MKALGEAETVIVAGLDSRFSFSVAGVQVRRAVRRGARLVAVDARESNLARMADDWLRPRPGEEARALVWLCAARRRRAATGTLARACVGRRATSMPTLPWCRPPSIRLRGAGGRGRLEALAGHTASRPAARARRQHPRRAGARRAGGGPARPAAGADDRGLTLAEPAGRAPAQGALPRGRGALHHAARLRLPDRAGPVPAAVRCGRVPAGGLLRRGRRARSRTSRGACRS